MKNKYFITCSTEENIDLIIKQLITPGISPEGTNFTEFTPVENYLGVSLYTIVVELTEEEAEQFTLNPLVIDVTLVTEEIVKHNNFRTLNPVYSNSNNSLHTNWGMSRCNSLSAVQPWDSDFTYNKTGSGVDVVIIDSGIIPDHPEFLDENGNSRLVKENWTCYYPLTSNTDLSVSYSNNNYIIDGEIDATVYVVSDKLSNTPVYRTRVYSFNLDSSTLSDPFFIGSAVGAPFGSTYVNNNGATTGTVTLSVYGSNRSEYTTRQNVMYYWSGRDPSINGIITRTKFNTQPDDNLFYNDTDGHGTHCTSTVAGSALGWATDSKIYCIHIDFGGDIGGFSSNSTGLIEVYGLLKNWHNKKITSGNLRPTVTNNSYGYGVSYESVNLAVKDLTDSGIHFIHSAGNDAAFITIPTDPTFYSFRRGINGFNYPSHEKSPCFPQTLWTDQTNNPVICVGSLGSWTTTLPHVRADYSNYGPGVSLYAPGTYINGADYSNRGALYPGSNSYYVIKYSGTSMAGPQVAGILATVLEDHPTLSPMQAKLLLFENCVVGAISATNDSLFTGGGSYNDTRLYSLSGGNNYTLLKYPAKRIVPNLQSGENFAKYLSACYVKVGQVDLKSVTYGSNLGYMNTSNDLTISTTCG